MLKVWVPGVLTMPVADDFSATEARSIALTVIMPAYNEEASIQRAVHRSVRAISPVVNGLEIIIINDGSTDQTGEIADTLAKEDPHVRVLHNEQNLNYGESLARGIAVARGEWILHNGMDLPLAPEDVVKFLPLFPSADVLVARRCNRSAHSPWRKVTSWTNNLLLRLLFAPRSTDLNFVQFYRREVIQPMRTISSSPAFVTPELILRCERTGKRVREVEVEFCRRVAGKAHFGRPRDILWTLQDMLRFRLLIWRNGWEL